MFSIFKNKKEVTDYLLEQKSNEATYLLSTKTVLNANKDSEPVVFETQSKIFVNQKITQDNWSTGIDLLSITGTTSHKYMEEYLQEAIGLSSINSSLIFKREKDGRVKKVQNKKELIHNWNRWRKSELPTVIPDLRKQKKFVENTEAMLHNIDEVKNTHAYLLIMPPLFDLPKYPNGTLDVKNVGVWQSRFVENVDKTYHYKVKQVKVGELVDLKFTGVDFSDLNNSFFLKSFYQQYLQNHDPASYKVQIVGNYRLEQATGKILEGNLIQTEQFNQGFYYEIFNKLKIIS